MRGVRTRRRRGCRSRAILITLSMQRRPQHPPSVPSRTPCTEMTCHRHLRSLSEGQSSSAPLNGSR